MSEKRHIKIEDKLEPKQLVLRVNSMVCHKCDGNGSLFKLINPQTVQESKCPNCGGTGWAKHGWYESEGQGETQIQQTVQNLAGNSH